MRCLLTGVVGAAFLVASCSGTGPIDSTGPPATAVPVASTAAPEAAAPTALPTTQPDAASTSTAVAQPQPQAPPATVPPVAPATAPGVVPPTIAARRGAGDLGLSQPITELECRGQYLTIVGAATDRTQYREVVRNLLAANPGSNYARTEYACSSLIPRVADGSAVYVVFHGPFDTIRQACSALARGPLDAYVKVLRNISPREALVDC